MAQRTRRYLIRRVTVVLLTLFVVTLLSFLLMRLSPVDPATAYVKRNSAVVTQEQIDEARVILGLDKPLPVQYFDWVVDALHMDFRISLGTGNPVTEELAKTVPVTLTVVAYSAVIMSLGVLGSRDAGVPLAAESRRHDPLLSDHDRHFRAWLLSGYRFYRLVRGAAGLDQRVGKQRFCPVFPGGALPVGLGDLFYGQMLAASLEREMEQDYAMYFTVPRAAGWAHPPIPCVSSRCGGPSAQFCPDAGAVPRQCGHCGAGVLPCPAWAT